MNLKTLVIVLSILAVTSACKKKGAGKDDSTTSSDKADRSGGGDRDARADTASTGTVSVDGDGNAPEFGALYFEFDSATLTADARASLQVVGDWLTRHPAARVTIEGHADERGTTEYNIALGQRRAEAIQDYLARLGVNKNRLTTISYGEERPASDGDDESAWAQNRRGELAPDR